MILANPVNTCSRVAAVVAGSCIRHASKHGAAYCR